MINDVILASASPRRIELLKYIFERFAVCPANIDENISGVDNVEEIPEKLAILKASAVAKNNREALVIGSDTSVVIDNEILGKPKNRAHCKEMLQKLSGRKHKVITGCAIIQGDKISSFSETTQVEFYSLSDNEIENYLNTTYNNGNFIWADKAGGYGIQEKAGLFVKGIIGDYNTVVGLPIGRLNKELKNFKR